MLCLVSLTITTSSCSTNLPADFPKPPVIGICTNIIITKIFDRAGAPLVLPKAYDQNGKELPLVATYWSCQQTNSKSKTVEPPDRVQVGVSVDDWDRGQEYRREAEAYIIKNVK